MKEAGTHEPSRPSGLRFAGVLIALAVCAGAQWYIARKLYWNLATPALVIGALAAAVLLGRPAAESGAADPPAAAPGGVRRTLGLILSALGLAGFACATYILFTAWFVNFTVGGPLMLASVALWSAGLTLSDAEWRNNGPKVPVTNWEVGVLIAIVAFGFFLRFYRYGYFPPPEGFCAVEEPQSGMGAFDILYRGARPWEFLLDRWMPVPFFALFGQTVTALRLPFTIVSGLTLVALYLLVRELVSRGVALFATALLAMSQWHLIYARLAHAVFPTTLIVVIILYLCVRAHRRGGLALYPWIGFLSAYTLYTYAGYRGTAPMVLVFLGFSVLGRLLAWWRAPSPGAGAVARRNVRVQAVGLVFALVAFVGPVIVLIPNLRGNPVYYFEAANRSLANTDYYTHDVNLLIAQRVKRLTDTAKIFNHFGDGYEAYNLPGAPMLDPVTGVLFTVGLFYCLVWGLHRWQGFFAISFLVLLIMGTTFVQNLAVCRLQVIVPLVFVLIAFVVDRFAQIATAQFGRRVVPALVAVALVLGGVAFAGNYDTYFRRMMNEPRVRIVYHNQYTAAIRYLHTLPDGAYMLLVSDILNFYMGNDYTWWRGERIPGSVTADLLPVFTGQKGPWTGHDLRVVMQEPFDREDMVRLIRERFSAARCERVIHPERAPHLEISACQVPAQPNGQGFHGGIHARYFRGDITIPFLERAEPAISYAFLPDQCGYWQGMGKQPCRVEWEGTFDVPEAGLYDFSQEIRQGTMSVTVDDQPIQGPIQLSAGPHVVRAQARFQTQVEIGARLRWRRNGTDEWRLVEFATFDGAAAQASRE